MGDKSGEDWAAVMARTQQMWMDAWAESFSHATKAPGLGVGKPDPADAPSDMAAIGRYILPHEIFEELARTRPGQGAEIQLTDAIDALGGLAAFPITEPRFDCGSKEGLFEASRAVREARIQTTGELHIAAE